MNVEKGKEKIKALKKELAQAVQDALDDRDDITSRHVTALRAEIAELEKKLARYKKGEGSEQDDDENKGDKTLDVLDMEDFFNT